MPQIQFSEHARKALEEAWQVAVDNRHQFAMPEHLLFALLGQKPFQEALEYFTESTKGLYNQLLHYLHSLESVPEMDGDTPTIAMSAQMEQLLKFAHLSVEHSTAESVGVPHLVNAMLKLGFASPL